MQIVKKNLLVGGNCLCMTDGDGVVLFLFHVLGCDSGGGAAGKNS